MVVIFSIIPQLPFLVRDNLCMTVCSQVYYCLLIKKYIQKSISRHTYSGICSQQYIYFRIPSHWNSLNNKKDISYIFCCFFPFIFILLCNEMCLNRTSSHQLLCSEQTGVLFIQVKLTKISYIRTLFIVRFMHAQDSVLFRVQVRQISLYYLYMFMVQLVLSAYNNKWLQVLLISRTVQFFLICFNTEILAYCWFKAFSDTQSFSERDLLITESHTMTVQLQSSR